MSDAPRHQHERPRRSSDDQLSDLHNELTRDHVERLFLVGVLVGLLRQRIQLTQRICGFPGLCFERVSNTGPLAELAQLVGARAGFAQTFTCDEVVFDIRWRKEISHLDGAEPIVRMPWGACRGARAKNPYPASQRSCPTTISRVPLSTYSLSS